MEIKYFGFMGEVVNYYSCYNYAEKGRVQNG